MLVRCALLLSFVTSPAAAKGGGGCSASVRTDVLYCRGKNKDTGVQYCTAPNERSLSVGNTVSLFVKVGNRAENNGNFQDGIFQAGRQAQITFTCAESTCKKAFDGVLTYANDYDERAPSTFAMGPCVNFTGSPNYCSGSLAIENPETGCGCITLTQDVEVEGSRTGAQQLGIVLLDAEEFTPFEIFADVTLSEDFFIIDGCSAGELTATASGTAKARFLQTNATKYQSCTLEFEIAAEDCSDAVKKEKYVKSLETQIATDQFSLYSVDGNNDDVVILPAEAANCEVTITVLLNPEASDDEENEFIKACDGAPTEFPDLPVTITSFNGEFFTQLSPPSPVDSEEPFSQQNLPTCGCTDYYNQLKSTYKGYEACQKHQAHGLKGMQIACIEPNGPRIPLINEGCPSGTHRCVIRDPVDAPKKPCKCTKYANGLAPSSTTRNGQCVKVENGERICYPRNYEVYKAIGGSEDYGCRSDMHLCAD